MRCTLLATTALLSTAALVLAAEPGWPGWRGPRQNGVASGPGTPLQWSDHQNLRWKLDLPGEGNSSPIVWGDRIFLTAATKTGSERWVLCIDRKQGKLLWQQTAAKDCPPEKTHDWNTNASASCATDGERVYAFFSSAGFFCYDVNGQLVWKKDLGKFGCSTNWGSNGASPVLFEDLVIVNGDQGALGSQRDERGVDYGPSYLWALNKKSGQLVWQMERNQGMGWSTPLIVKTPAGRTEMIVNSPHGVWSYDPRTGKELWRVRGRGPEELFGEIAPVWDDRHLYAFTGRPGPLYAIRWGGQGDVTDTHVAWKVRRGDRDVSSPLLLDQHLYQVDRKGVLVCIDKDNGKTIWSHRLNCAPCASFVQVQGAIVLVTDTGTTYVFEPGTSYKQLHVNKLGDGEQFRASPAIVEGQLLIRSNRRLYCIAATQS